MMPSFVQHQLGVHVVVAVQHQLHAHALEQVEDGLRERTRVVVLRKCVLTLWL